MIARSILIVVSSYIGCVICTQISEYWRYDTQITWQTTTGTTIFTIQVQRPLECASICSSVTDCLVFGFSNVTNTCQGYSRLQTPIGVSPLSVIGSTENIYKNDRSCSRTGFDFIQEGRLCVKIFTNNVNWDDAKMFCEMYYGRLIVIDTEQKMNAFSEYLDTMGYASDRLWIGTTDKADEGTWVWLNGHGLDQSYWDEVILNDVCVENLFAFTAECGRIQYRSLSDDTCSILQAYVCERPDIV